MAARDGERAAEFARRYDAPRSYGSYDDLVADDDGRTWSTSPRRTRSTGSTPSPRSPPAEPVLVEKPLTLTAAGARDGVRRRPRRRGSVAMERHVDAHQPAASGRRWTWSPAAAIGEVRAVQADFAFALDYDPGHRLFDRDNGGGALLDLGIYPATFAWLFAGPPGPDADASAPATVAADRRGPHRGDAVVWEHGARR